MRDGVSDEEEVRVCFAHDAARGFMPGRPVVNHEVPVLGAGNQRGGYGPGGRRSGHDEGFRGRNAALSPEQAEADARAEMCIRDSAARQPGDAAAAANQTGGF